MRDVDDDRILTDVFPDQPPAVFEGAHGLCAGLVERAEAVRQLGDLIGAVHLSDRSGTCFAHRSDGRDLRPSIVEINIGYLRAPAVNVGTRAARLPSAALALTTSAAPFDGRRLPQYQCELARRQLTRP